MRLAALFLLAACAPDAPTSEHRARVAGYDLAEAGDWAGALVCFQDAGDLEDQAHALHALGQHERAAELFARLITDDPLTTYNLGAALRDAGHDARPWFWDVAARTHPADPLLAETLLVLAEDSTDPKLVALLIEAAEELTDGQ